MNWFACFQRPSKPEYVADIKKQRLGAVRRRGHKTHTSKLEPATKRLFTATLTGRQFVMSLLISCLLFIVSFCFFFSFVVLALSLFLLKF